MDYKQTHAPFSPKEAELFFKIFRSLDCPAEDEDSEDLEDPEDQDPPTLGLEAQESDALQTYVRRLKDRSSSSLSLPPELSGTEQPKKTGVASKRKASTPKTTVETPKDQDPQSEPDLQIVEEVAPAVSPLRSPPAPPAPPAESGLDRRVSSLERALLSMAQDIKKIARTQTISSHRVTPREYDSYSDEESEEDPVPIKMSRKEKREMFLSSLRDINPELQHPVATPSSADSSHFDLFQQKEDKTIMPFAPLLSQEIARAAEAKIVGSTKKKDPFKVVDKYYKTMEPVESTLLQPRQVPSSLLDEIAPEKLQNPGASGMEARLKLTTPAGQKELAALRELRRASSYLRLINSQELAVQAVHTLNTKMSSDLDALLVNPEVPPSILQQLKAIKFNSSTTATAIEDLKQGDSHLAKCAITQYIEAIRERQHAWVSSSSLPQPMQSEITKSQLAMPKGMSTAPLSILGTQAESIIQSYTQRRKDDVFREWYQQRSHSSGAGRRRFRKQKTEQTAASRPQPLSSQAQAAGWSTAFPPRRGRGRGGNRGQSNTRGRGRGSQPFLSTKPTTSTQ